MPCVIQVSTFTGARYNLCVQIMHTVSYHISIYVLLILHHYVYFNAVNEGSSNSIGSVLMESVTLFV